MASESAAGRPRILYLDAYDSFSNNIIAQVEQCTGAEVVKCTIDSDCRPSGNYDSALMEPVGDRNSHFIRFLQDFDAVVAGPGPGWAECDKDVGLMKALWSLSEDDMLPVLGICLGFQSMCLAFGASIERLQVPRHGLVAEILHSGRSIFNGVEDLVATQYHSLQVKIGHQIQLTKSVRYPAQLWEATETCPELEPLAWDFDSKKNGAVLMASKHKSRPFWGVQFHPESICTNEQGLKIIRNWWDDAQSWKRKAGLRQSIPLSLSQTELGFLADAPGRPNASVTCSQEDLAFMVGCGAENGAQGAPSTSVHCATTGSGRLTVSDIVETFNIPQGEAIVLESGLQSDLVPIAAGTGRHSIIGLILPGETPRIHYYTGTQTMQIRDGKDRVVREWPCPAPWQWIRNFMSQLRETISSPPTTPTWAPFWGGLMGYASYEAGLETIDVQVPGSSAYPDICFAYITRSIVVDHQLKKIYVQSIRGPEDGAWIRESWERLYEAAGRKSAESTPNRTPMPRADPFEQDSTLNTYLSSCAESFTDRDRYCASVASCQAEIADGQSYELCLTSSNQIRARKPRVCRLSRAENNDLSWKLYKKLSLQNPAPFAAYIRLHNVHLLSSSPERYISWDRAQTAQCRPIKGTVAKKPGVTFSDAYAILSSSKERAENLMIVDLVRHQLHGVYGSGQVHVRKLMQIEEYKTVWQLVSVVEGVPRGVKKPETPEEWEDPLDQVSGSAPAKQDYQGYDAFVESLPPGSMTGAPKKRSCELLLREEGAQRRGIYSGVLGYLDVGGGGDFSVVIRTAVKVEDSASASASTEDVWTIGAGGAITAQSSPEAEYDEMLAKLHSTARAFKPQEAAPHVGTEQLGKLDGLVASVAVHGGGIVGAEGDTDADDIARTLLGTLENFRAQLETLEREALVLNREQRG